MWATKVVLSPKCGANRSPLARQPSENLCKLWLCWMVSFVFPEHVEKACHFTCEFFIWRASWLETWHLHAVASKPATNTPTQRSQNLFAVQKWKQQHSDVFLETEMSGAQRHVQKAFYLRLWESKSHEFYHLLGRQPTSNMRQRTIRASNSDPCRLAARCTFDHHQPQCTNIWDERHLARVLSTCKLMSTCGERVYCIYQYIFW